MDVSGDHTKSTKDFWDKIRTIAIAAIPVVIAVVGNSFAASMKEKEIRLKTVEIAITVLSQDPKVHPSLPQLREWAVTVVNDYSGIPLSATAREELLKNPLPSAVTQLLSSSFGGKGGGILRRVIR